MAVDTLDECGIGFGTTGSQVYASADAGDSWNPIVRDLPSVLSVEVQTIRVNGLSELGSSHAPRTLSAHSRTSSAAIKFKMRSCLIPARIAAARE